MNRFKRVFVILLALILLTGLMDVSLALDENTSKKESTSSLSPKKIVAVLYDDSGSMQ